MTVQQYVTRARFAVGSIGAVALTNVFAVAAGMAYVGYLRSLDPEGVVPDLPLVASEAAHAAAGLAQFLAFLVAVVCFIRWFRPAYANLALVTGQPTRRNPRWAIWGFFVPFLNLIRPYQLMREIWERTCRRWTARAWSAAGRRRPADLVNLWWGLFLITNFLANRSAALSWTAVTPADTMKAVASQLLADLLSIVAAAVAILLVRRITEMQRSLLEEREYADTHAPLHHPLRSTIGRPDTA